MNKLTAVVIKDETTTKYTIYSKELPQLTIQSNNVEEGLEKLKDLFRLYLCKHSFEISYFNFLKDENIQSQID